MKSTGIGDGRARPGSALRASSQKACQSASLVISRMVVGSFKGTARIVGASTVGTSMPASSTSARFPPTLARKWTSPGRVTTTRAVMVRPFVSRVCPSSALSRSSGRMDQMGGAALAVAAISTASPMGTM
ncbi:hypothetical protein D3C72_911610 [compost metagenome]